MKVHTISLDERGERRLKKLAQEYQFSTAGVIRYLLWQESLRLQRKKKAKKTNDGKRDSD